MPLNSKILASIPDEIDIAQSWNLRYWAGELGVSQERLKQVVGVAGKRPKQCRKFLKDGVRIAVRDDSGVLRLAVRLSTERGGFAASVPYHPAKEGWVVEHVVDYSERDAVIPVSEMTQHVVNDTVKLSLHMNGFVQFSSAARHSIVSGFNSELQKPKGVGLYMAEPVDVTSGPLFGVILQGLHHFRPLKDEDAEVFEIDDRWHHPKYSGSEHKNLNIEFFMFPTSEVVAIPLVVGKRIMRRRLPFYGAFKFDHELRVIEFAGLEVALGVIVSRMPCDNTSESGYKICGPSLKNDQGDHITIAAWYPRPHFVDPGETQSLDYKSETNDQLTPGQTSG